MGWGTVRDVVTSPWDYAKQLGTGAYTAGKGIYTIAEEMYEDVSGITAEKMAMGWYLNGRVSAVIGTHTHIQTADETILDRGTAYITDVGMTGPYNSVIGMKKEIAIKRFIQQLPERYQKSRSGQR